MIRIALTEIVGAAVALLVVGPLAWWAMDSDPPLRIIGSPKVENAGPVPIRSALRVQYRGAYLRRCSGEGQRVFVDVVGHVMSIDPYQFRDGIGSDGRPVTLGVDRDLPPVAAPVPGGLPGPARYQNITHFYCNPLQKALRWGITFRYPVVDFIIADKTAPQTDHATTVFAPIIRDHDASEVLDNEAPAAPGAAR